MKRTTLSVMILIGLIACSPKMRTAPEVKAPESASAIARGEYLANSVAVCVGCHSERDGAQTGGPVISGAAFAGGIVLTEENSVFYGEGLPGIIQAKNITQDHAHGIGAWTDGEIARAIREGVTKAGEPLFPMMPYGNYKHMSDEDLLSIIAYLRTLAPNAKEDRDHDLNFPLSVIVNFIPQPLENSVPNPATDQVSRGQYLARIASCADCHSPAVRGELVEGKEWSGGVIISEHGFGAVVSSNLTPDAATGIGSVTDEQWLKIFREGVGKDGRPLNATMPWTFYKGMTDEDLLAILAYLRTVPVVQNDTMAVLAEYLGND